MSRDRQVLQRTNPNLGNLSQAAAAAARASLGKPYEMPDEANLDDMAAPADEGQEDLGNVSSGRYDSVMKQIREEEEEELNQNQTQAEKFYDLKNLRIHEKRMQERWEKSQEEKERHPEAYARYLAKLKKAKERGIVPFTGEASDKRLAVPENNIEMRLIDEEEARKHYQAFQVNTATLAISCEVTGGAFEENPERNAAPEEILVFSSKSVDDPELRKRVKKRVVESTAQGNIIAKKSIPDSLALSRQNNSQIVVFESNPQLCLPGLGKTMNQIIGRDDMSVENLDDMATQDILVESRNTIILQQMFARGDALSSHGEEKRPIYTRYNLKTEEFEVINPLDDFDPNDPLDQIQYSEGKKAGFIFHGIQVQSDETPELRQDLRQYQERARTRRSEITHALNKRSSQLSLQEKIQALQNRCVFTGEGNITQVGISSLMSDLDSLEPLIDYDVIDFLCKAQIGFHPNQTDPTNFSNYSYLIHAIRNGRVKIVEYFLSKYLNCLLFEDKDMVIDALLGQFCNFEMFEMVIFGQDFLGFNEDFARAYSDFNSIFFKSLMSNTDIVFFENILSLNIADVNAVQQDGFNRTPLMHFLTRDGQKTYFQKKVQLLIENGADLKHKDAHGKSALFFISELPLEEFKFMLDILLESGLEINDIDNERNSPLYDLLSNHSKPYNTDIDKKVEYFIQKGAKVNLRNKEGKNAQILASDNIVGYDLRTQIIDFISSEHEQTQEQEEEEEAQAASASSSHYHQERKEPQASSLSYQARQKKPTASPRTGSGLLSAGQRRLMQRFQNRGKEK